MHTESCSSATESNINDFHTCSPLGNGARPNNPSLDLMPEKVLFNNVYLQDISNDRKTFKSTTKHLESVFKDCSVKEHVHKMQWNGCSM